MLTFTRAALACYFTFIAVFYTAKLMALRARTGRRHAERGRAGTAQWFGHTLFIVLRAGIWAICLARVAAPGIDGWFGPLLPITTAPVAGLGLAFLAASLGGVVYIHSFLGEAWRSGVGAGRPAALVTGGPYARVRHPLFVAVGTGQIGFVLAWPSLFSLACLGLGITSLIVQAQYEERHMEAWFGPAWRSYANRTPAFWPPSGPGQAGDGVPGA
ncbi:methyltransferase family protein [Salinarimonas soli]|uniref:methyltransferase family protein n=1 Tax=Salinarimonas soli TaxID=1638099 RepID=UPI001F0B05E2|nr:isoprenylcysteine carboxylmethyltransferase family protein [Salinarimonas soli]